MKKMPPRVKSHFYASQPLANIRGYTFQLTEQEDHFDHEDFREKRHQHLFLVSLSALAAAYVLYLILILGYFISDMVEDSDEEFGMQDMLVISKNFKWFFVAIFVGIGGFFAFVFLKK